MSGSSCSTCLWCLSRSPACSDASARPMRIIVGSYAGGFRASAGSSFSMEGRWNFADWIRNRPEPSQRNGCPHGAEIAPSTLSPFIPVMRTTLTRPFLRGSVVGPRCCPTSPSCSAIIRAGSGPTVAPFPSRTGFSTGGMPLSPLGIEPSRSKEYARSNFAMV